MNLYSQFIGEFLFKVRSWAKEILKDEMKLKVGRSRFYFKSYSYPLKFVVFEKDHVLGEFHSDLWHIGLNKQVMLWPEHQIKNILRHELLHYLCHIQYGELALPHGEEFKNLAKSFGYTDEVYKASFKIEQTDLKKRSQLAEKIKKLLNLSQSTNFYESQLALEKAQALIHEHGLDFSFQEDFFYGVLLLEKANRSSQKMSSIMRILSEFCVYPVLNYGKNFVYLEITGLPHHLEIAQFVFSFLHLKIEELWELHRKEYPKSKGISHKNSFIKGLEMGFIHSLKSKQDISMGKDLMKHEKELAQVVRSFYGQLSQGKKGQGKLQLSSLESGKKKGSALSIPKGLKQKANRLLGYSP
ncbi:MAG: DUF2786 domain-containing protein [Halobacteriovoraceae bacterium]|nr:DUF2786 domain-containing protein [Halobacteriovoraceae bacterium]